MNILIIAATHGNELLGPKLINYIISKRPELLEHLDFIIGNPRAYAKRVRYIESDLNRSYQLGEATYEQRRANEIEHYIKITKPDLVIDMHTTSCVQPSIMIVRDLEHPLVRRYLRNCHIENVLRVTTTHDSASLVDSLVAYEVMNRDVTPVHLSEICNDIESFVSDKVVTATKSIYQMTDKIYKKDVTKQQAESFVNFAYNVDLGFVPIMTGENSYKKQTDYLGFKSKKPVFYKLDT